eukprot:SAG31_NODE_5015_length_2800_cov_2.011847_1_plen_446_part_00
MCEWNDTHCERNDAGQNVFALLNLMHPSGYRLPPPIMALASTETREVSSSFIGQAVDINGNMHKFAQRYNFVRNDSYTLGSASQDYITNTHTKYFPGPQDQLLDIQLGVPHDSMVRPLPMITLQPDYLDCPYGHIHEPNTDKPSHLALHPGMVQKRNVLLATTAINVQDTLDGFALNTSHPAGKMHNDGSPWNSVSTSLVLPLAAQTIWIADGGSSSAAATPFRIPDHAFNVSVKVGATMGLAVGRGAVAFRIFAADTSAQQPSESDGSAPMFLEGDDRGMPLGAIRLVAYHFKGHYNPPDPSSKQDTHLRFGVLFKLAAVPDSSAAPAVVSKLIQSLKRVELRVQTEGSSSARLWNVSATVDMSEPAVATALQTEMVSLTVVRNLTCSESLLDNKNQSVHTRWNCLVSRRVNGVEATAGHLTINGKLAPTIPPHIGAVAVGPGR